MTKPEKTVKRETVYIAVFVLLFTALEQAFFLVFGKWELKVLLGNALGSAVAVLNFYLMGITVQKAVMRSEKDAANLMKISQFLRMLLIFAFALLAWATKVFDLLAFVIPLIFPRVAIMFRPLFKKYFPVVEGESHAPTDGTEIQAEPDEE